MSRNTIYIGLAKFFSNFAAYIYEIGVLIYIYEETDSVLAVSGLIVSQIIPTLLVMLVGNIIDKFNNQILLYIYNAMKICSLCILVVYKEIFVIYIVTFLLNLLFEVEGSTVQCLIARSVNKEHLLKESAIINFFDSVSFFIAPLISAIIVKLFSVNINIFIAIGICCISIIFYSLTNFRLEKSTLDDKRLQEQRVITNKNFLSRQLIPPTIFWCVFMFLIGIASPIEIYMIKNILNMSSVYYAIGNGVEGVGMIIATCYIIKFVSNFSSQDIIQIGLVLSAISYFIIGISYNIFVYLIGAILVGITSTFCPLGFKTEIQQICNKKTIGTEYTRIRMLIMIFRILGILLVGILSDTFEIRYIYFSLTIVLIVTAILFNKYKSSKQIR